MTELGSETMLQNKAYVKQLVCKTRKKMTSEKCGWAVPVMQMTEKECQDGGKALNIGYCFQTTSFGDILLAWTDKGICRLDFAEDHATALKRFKLSFPKAAYLLGKGFAQGEVMTLLKGKGTGLRFHVKGTDFQLRVWRTLLCIQRGGLITYGDIAELTSNSKACRAVGSAVGDNPVSLLIPCHRVVLSSGELGNYAWGLERKAAILRWELE